MKRAIINGLRCLLPCVGSPNNENQEGYGDAPVASGLLQVKGALDCLTVDEVGFEDCESLTEEECLLDFKEKTQVSLERKGEGLEADVNPGFSVEHGDGQKDISDVWLQLHSWNLVHIAIVGALKELNVSTCDMYEDESVVEESESSEELDDIATDDQIDVSELFEECKGISWKKFDASVGENRVDLEQDPDFRIGNNENQKDISEFWLCMHSWNIVHIATVRALEELHIARCDMYGTGAAVEESESDDELEDTEINEQIEVSQLLEKYPLGSCGKKADMCFGERAEDLEEEPDFPIEDNENQKKIAEFWLDMHSCNLVHIAIARALGVYITRSDVYEYEEKKPSEVEAKDMDDEIVWIMNDEELGHRIYC